VCAPRWQVRLLQQKLGELLDGRSTLLPQFVALDQMVLLITLERPADIQYYKLGGQEGGLTEDDIRRVLKQRVEFDAAVVDKLKIQ
jgi:hypothetical protein